MYAGMVPSKLLSLTLLHNENKQVLLKLIVLDYFTGELVFLIWFGLIGFQLVLTQKLCLIELYENLGSIGSSLN